MRRRRQTLAALALLALAVSVGCNRDQRKVVGVVAKGRSHLFWQSVHAGANAAAREHNVRIEWNAPANESDIPAQVQIIDAMINRRVDAIALAPIDKVALIGVTERASREKIPVIIFDSGIDTENFVSQVATDNYKAGQMAADRMAQLLGGKGKVAIVAVQPGAASTMAREQGFEDAVKQKYSGISILDKRFGMAYVAQSLTVTENMLTAHPGLNALFASNESSTVGAAQALRSRQSKVKLVGFDSSPKLVEELNSGLIDSLVVQHPFKMGYEAVTAAVRKLNGEAVTKINNLPPTLVTKENLNQPEIQAQLNPDLKKYLE